MQYGILMFPTRHPIDVAVLARQAEALGFASLWVGEHPIMRVHASHLSLPPLMAVSPTPIAGFWTLLLPWHERRQ